MNHTKLLATILSQVPSDCPFARTVVLAGHRLKIPPLCKLNPFYGKLMSAKFWAMEYLEKQQ